MDTYADDRICFYLSGPGQSSKPLGCVTIENDGDPASIELSPCDIACFFNNEMTLTYTVQFPNGNQPQQSPEQVINVSLPQFPHPGIEQATGSTLCLNTFFEDATAFVPEWDYVKCAKCCWMWITGERENGSAIRIDILVDAPVKDARKTNGVAASITRAELQKLADCSEFELHFAASFCGKCELEDAHEFPVQTFKIEQEPLVLIEPSVREAVADQLTAWNGSNGVHVEVKYAGSNPNHSISVCWKRPDGSCRLLTPKPGSTTGAVVWLLRPEAVIESMGKVVEIIYTVTTACKVQTSPPLNLEISLPVRLETPNVLEATPPKTQNAVLDLRTFAGDANSLEDPMWFLRAGQTCSLRADGTDKSGNPYSFNVYSARTITVAEETAGVASPVWRSELVKSKDKANLTFTFSVATNGGSTANVVCPSRMLIMRLPFCDHTDFNPDDKGWNGWQRGPGATDLRDLRLKQGAVPGIANGNYLEDWGFTDTDNPVTQREKMFKNYTELETGSSYEFSAWVRDSYTPGTGRKPGLVLVVQGKNITPVTRPGTAWQLLKGNFQATSNFLRLSVDNMEMGIDPVNDFDITGITVKEI